MVRASSEALAKIGSPAVPDLLAILTDKDRRTREIAADTLGEIKSPEAIPGLLKALRDSDHDVRISAALALGKIGRPAIDELRSLLTNRDVRWAYKEGDTDIKVKLRYYAAEALVAMGVDATGVELRKEARQVSEDSMSRKSPPLVTPDHYESPPATPVPSVYTYPHSCYT
jgi:HEAT repeat protein